MDINADEHPRDSHARLKTEMWDKLGSCESVFLSTHVPVPAPLADLPWSHQTLYRGAEIFREGQPVESVYYLESGLVKLSRKWEGSQRPLIVRLVRPGELVGDRPAQTRQVRSHSAEALATSRCASLPLNDFQSIGSASPEVLFWIASQVEQRLADAERRVALIAFAQVDLRLLSLLADIAGVSGTQLGLPEHVNIPISQADLAQLAGATRETASTILNAFEWRGLLRLGRRQIEVLSLEALRQAVQDEQAGPKKDRAKGAHA